MTRIASHPILSTAKSNFNTLIACGNAIIVKLLPAEQWPQKIHNRAINEVASNEIGIKFIGSRKKRVVIEVYEPCSHGLSNLRQKHRKTHGRCTNSVKAKKHVTLAVRT